MTSVWYNHDHGARFVDLNADGRPDVAARRDDVPGPVLRTFPSGAWLNTASGWVEAPSYEPPVSLVGFYSFVSAFPAGVPTSHQGDAGARFADLNGDGLPDLVKTAVSGLAGASFEEAGVWLNSGSGWCGASGCGDAEARYAPPENFARFVTAAGECANQYGNGWRVVSRDLHFGDLNGDGHLDLFRAANNARNAWLHSPGDSPVWTEDARFEPPRQFTDSYYQSGMPATHYFDTGTRVADVDGNGAADFVWRNTTGANSSENWLARSTFPDRLKEYRNGRGGVVGYEYQSAITQQDGAREADALGDAETRCELGLHDPDPDGVGTGCEVGETLTRWRRQPVVSGISVHGVDNAGVGEAYETTLAYARPQWCPVQRSGLGFRLVEALLDDGSQQRSYFWQDHGRAGRVSRSEVLEAGQVRFVEEFTWEVVDGGAVTGSLAGVDVGRKTGEARHSEYGGSPGATRSVTLVPDDNYGYNFVGTVTISRPTGQLTVTRTPEDADLANWIVGKLDAEVHSSGSTILRSRRFDYVAGRGLLERLEVDVQPRSGGGTPATAVSEWEYDVNGNLIKFSEAVGQPQRRDRYFCYDGGAAMGPHSCPARNTATHTLLPGYVDPRGGFSQFEGDLGTGETRALDRFNNDHVEIDVDPFDRPIALRVTPAASQTGSTLIETRSYYDIDDPDDPDGPADRPHVVRLQKTGNGDDVRIATYSDGLGRVSRQVFTTPTPAPGYFGRATLYDHAGRAVTRTYDQACGSDAHCSGLPLAGGPEVSIVYDALGRIKLRQTPDGGVWFADYGAIVGPPGPHGGNAFDFALLKDARGAQTLRALDGDRLAWVVECDVMVGPDETDPGNLDCDEGDSTVYTYEATGEVSTIFDAMAGPGYDDPNHSLVYEYDTVGQVLQLADPDGGTTSASYDLLGNVRKVTNAREQETTFIYDDLGRPYLILRPEGENYLTVITYDDTGDGHTRKRKAVDEIGGYSSSHEYDEFGRESRKVLTVLDRTFVTDFEYDLLGRITKINYPNNGQNGISYVYEGAYLEKVCDRGNLADCESGNHRYHISDVTYDELGRAAGIQTYAGLRSETFDPLTQRLATRTLTNAQNDAVLSLSFTDYDELGNLESIQDQHDGVLTDDLDATANYRYDARGRLAWHDLATKHGGTELSFGYDPLGNLSARDFEGATPTSDNQFYAGPRPHAITSIVRGGQTTRTYDYDADGNQTWRVDAVDPTRTRYIEYDSANRPVCVGTSEATPCNRIQYAYDIDGVRLYEADSVTGDVRILVEDLFEWDVATHTAVTHVFAFGRRIATRTLENASLRSTWTPPAWPLPDDATPWLWGAAALGSLGVLSLLARRGAWVLITERPATALTATGTAFALVFLPVPRARATGGGGAAAVNRYLFYDHLGSNVLVVNDDGDVIHRRVFEPFGQVIAEGDATGDPPSEVTHRLYTGQRFESLSGLYDFKARWYDPETGRFLSVDPIVQSVADPQTHNAYGYVRNNPVNYVDPNGRFVELIGGVIVGYLAIALQTAVRLIPPSPSITSAIAPTLLAASPVAANAESVADVTAEASSGESSSDEDPENADSSLGTTPIERIEERGVKLASMEPPDIEIPEIELGPEGIPTGKLPNLPDGRSEYGVRNARAATFLLRAAQPDTALHLSVEPVVNGRSLPREVFSIPPNRTGGITIEAPIRFGHQFPADIRVRVEEIFGNDFFIGIDAR